VADAVVRRATISGVAGVLFWQQAGSETTVAEVGVLWCWLWVYG
jgi:hypothetical protein